MTREEAQKILAEYVKACREDDMLTLEQFVYEEVIEAMSMGAEALSVCPVYSNLEEAANEYEKVNTGIYPEVGQTSIRDAFIDGAKWQKEQYHFFNEAWADNMQYQLDRNYENGKQAMKEQMMKEAVEGEIVKDNRGNNVLRVGLLNNGFEIGNKVRIIIVREDEK